MRHFETSISSGIGIIVGIIFLGLVIVWTIAMFKYPTWFGSFKKHFFKFQISQHFYVFVAAERLISAAVVVSINPGPFSPGVIAGIFLIASIFIAVKKPYTLGSWKRPFINTIGATLVASLFVGASITKADSTINQMIPLAVLLILVILLTIGTIGAISKLKEYWS